jgi:hypothetical protein
MVMGLLAGILHWYQALKVLVRDRLKWTIPSPSRARRSEASWFSNQNQASCHKDPKRRRRQIKETFDEGLRILIPAKSGPFVDHKEHAEQRGGNACEEEETPGDPWPL